MVPSGAGFAAAHDDGRSVLSEKMRVHILAKELNVSSKTIIEKCQAEGIDTVKNHMSTLSAGLHATILEWFSEGIHDVAIETSNRIDLTKVRIKAYKRGATMEDGSAGSESGGVTAVELEEPPLGEPPFEEAEVESPTEVVVRKDPLVAGLPVGTAPPEKSEITETVVEVVSRGQAAVTVDVPPMGAEAVGVPPAVVAENRGNGSNRIPPDAIVA